MLEEVADVRAAEGEQKLQTLTQLRQQLQTLQTEMQTVSSAVLAAA